MEYNTSADSTKAVMRLDKMRSSEFVGTRFCEQLIEYVSKENDPLIVTNMIDVDTSWSLLNQMRDGRFEENGFLSVVSFGDMFVGIGGCERSHQVFPDSINIGIRCWVHSDFRAKEIPSIILAPQIQWAQDEKRVCWMSFNHSRKWLTRHVRKKKHSENPITRQRADGFESFPEPVIVNNVPQWITYRNFGLEP